MRTTRDWLSRDDSHRRHFDRIVFCVYDEEDVTIYNGLMPVFFPCAPIQPTATPNSNRRQSASTALQFPVSQQSKSSLVNPSERDTQRSDRRKTITFSADPFLTLVSSNGNGNGMDEMKEPSADSKSPSKPSSQPGTASRKRASIRMTPTQVATLLASQPPQPVVTQPPPNPFQHRPGQFLARFKYSYPKPPTVVQPAPRTADDLFTSSPATAFVPPPVIPTEGTKEYAVYAAHKSGEQKAAEQEKLALLQLNHGQPINRMRAQKRSSNVSLHGLAKLMNTKEKSNGDEEED